MTEVSKTVVCPACGADLQNAPRKDYAVCPACKNTQTYPRFTEPERTAAKRAALPLATRLTCHPTWWRIEGHPGIWSARFSNLYPGVVRARFQAAGGVRHGWSVDWFGRLEREEAELRDVLGIAVATEGGNDERKAT